jgi:hypothetical protein
MDSINPKITIERRVFKEDEIFSKTKVTNKIT